ncbi:MAG: hypothetical protein Q9163_001571, partial [Psora crenata]
MSSTRIPMLQARAYNATAPDIQDEISPARLSIRPTLRGNGESMPLATHAPLTPPSSMTHKQLEVLSKSGEEVKLMFVSPRESHLSSEIDSFAGLQLRGRSMEDIRTELEEVFRPKGYEDMVDARDHLRVAVGNMLERIISWDRRCAVVNEEGLGFKLLSSVPRADTISDIDAKYLVKQFRKAIKCLHEGDWRLPWAEMEENKLLALLYYTFLLSRPVLAWELDLEN